MYEAYLDSLQKRRRRRAALGVAASIMMIIIASFLLQQRSPPTPDLAIETACGAERIIGPRYRIEGRTLAEALDWLTSRAGIRLEFTDEESRSLARGIILHGDVSSLTLRQAMQAILSGSDLPYAMEESRLLVGPN